MSDKLILNMGMVDWITVTSWDNGFWHRFIESQGYKKSRGERDGWSESRFLQYAGVTKKLGMGTLFAGAGMQKMRVHNLCYVSGMEAHLLYLDLMRVTEDHKVSRLDFQVTVPMPDGWSQWTFFNRMKKAGRKVGWYESRDKHTGKNLETVYIGSRQSETFVRVYVKLDDEGRDLLRFEVEYKGGRADTVGKKLGRSKDRPGYIDGTILHEVQKLRDEQLSLCFEPVLSGVAIRTKVEVRKSRDRTKNWLLGQVLTALTRYILEHDDDGEVARAFYDAVGGAMGWH